MFNARVVRTGFEQWFQAGPAGAPQSPAWKQNMIVLLLLYPVCGDKTMFWMGMVPL